MRAGFFMSSSPPWLRARRRRGAKRCNVRVRRHLPPEVGAPCCRLQVGLDRRTDVRRGVRSMAPDSRERTVELIEEKPTLPFLVAELDRLCERVLRRGEVGLCLVLQHISKLRTVTVELLLAFRSGERLKHRKRSFHARLVGLPRLPSLVACSAEDLRFHERRSPCDSCDEVFLGNRRRTGLGIELATYEGQSFDVALLLIALGLLNLCDLFPDDAHEHEEIGLSECTAEVNARDQVDGEEAADAEDDERRSGEALSGWLAAQGWPEEVDEIADVARES